MDSTLHVALGGSRTLRLANLVGHVAAVLAVGWMALRDPAWWLLVAVIGGSLFDGDRRARGRHRHSWVRCRWAADDRIDWVRRDGATGRGRCIEARAWGAAWVRLRVRVARRRVVTLVLPRDAVSAEAHRRLRVRTRIAPPQHGAAADPFA